MKLFTHDLVKRLNSLDESEMDSVDAEWERRVDIYDAQLKDIVNRRPELGRLANLYLHDYERLDAESDTDGIAVSPGGRRWPPAAVIHLQGPTEMVTLMYSLQGELVTHNRPADWEWEKDWRVEWLYDEIEDSPEPGKGFVHHILWNNGTCTVIPFDEVIVIHSARESKPAEARRRENGLVAA